MPRRKSKNNISVDDLLALLDKDRKQLAKETDVFRFITSNNINAGINLVPNSVIYYLYLKEGKYRYYNRRAFFRHFSQFFKVKTVAYVRGYMLDGSLKPSEEDYINSRILTRKEQYEKKSKKKSIKEATKDSGTSENVIPITKAKEKDSKK